MAVYKMEDLEKEVGEKTEFKEKIGLNIDELITSHSDLIKKAVIPLEYAIHPILPTDGYVLLHAEAGVGKTYFALNLAYIVAQGGRFLKYAAPNPLKVLYVDAEMGEDAIRRRIDFFEKNHGKLFFDNLYYLNFNKFPNGIMPKIDTQEGREFYTEALIKGNYKGIFLDNLLNLTSIDHNKVTDWIPIQEWIKALRRQGVFFFLLHHTSGDVTKQYGTIAHNTAANTVISLQKIDDDEETGRIKVIYQKLRDAVPGTKTFEARNNLDGSWSLNEIEQSTYDQVLAWFKLGATGLQIAKTLNISAPAVSKHKKRAIEKGDLRVNKYGKIENLD